MKQTKLFKTEASDYGGSLFNTRKGRARARPLAVKSSMHLVLRSNKARGEWSLRRHVKKIEAIIARFSKKYGVRVHSMANVGNHLHLHMRLSHRAGYKPFIRAITSAIAMAVTGVSRWQKAQAGLKFWAQRPFTRIVSSYRAFLNLKDYIELNQIEGLGASRFEAADLLTRKKARRSATYSVKRSILQL